MVMLYDGLSVDDWRAELGEQSEWNVRHILAAFALLGRPKTMWDVGCGDGTMVSTARRLGVLAFGVDQLVDDTWGPDYFHHNLANKFEHGPYGEQVYCLEVAEHLDPSAHAMLCDTLVDLLKTGSGNYLVFSAAFPGQGGSGHLSERPARYWLDQFSLRTLGYRKDLSVNLALLWSNIGSPMYWLASNVMVFEK